MILEALGLMQSAPHPKVEIIATDQKPKLRAMPGHESENLSRHSQPQRACFDLILPCFQLARISAYRVVRVFGFHFYHFKVCTSVCLLVGMCMRVQLSAEATGICSPGAMVSHLTWMLGTEPVSSGRTASALTC